MIFPTPFHRINGGPSFGNIASIPRLFRRTQCYTASIVQWTLLHQLWPEISHLSRRPRFTWPTRVLLIQFAYAFVTSQSDNLS